MGLQVWRESMSEALSFFMVGYTIVDASYGFNQFEADISVQKGDVIGWYCSGIQPIKFDTDVGTVRRAYGFDGLTSPVSMAGHADGWSRTYSVRAEIDLDVGAEVDYIVDNQRASNHHVCSGYNSEGYHISMKQCQDLCNDQQGCVGIFGAFNTDNPNSVSGNGACYSCQSFDYGEIGWANTLLWKPTERIDSFSFDLRGRDGSERVRIDDGVIVRELVLSKEWTAFVTLSRFVQMSFENDDGSRDVYFRSNFDAEIQRPEVWVDWNCGFLNDLTEEENSRCQTVRSGHFAWRGDYQVEFIDRN